MFTMSGRRVVTALVSASFLACGSAAGQDAVPAPGAAAFPTRSLTLPEAIRQALERHPELRAARHGVAADEAALDQAGRLPNPELAYLREGQQAGSRTTTVQINQPIELGGKRQARVALARETLDLARTELALRRQALRAEVIEAWTGALIAQERRQLAASMADLARKSFDTVSRRVAAGKVSPIEAGKARLAQADAQAELARASAELAIARDKLGLLAGMPAARQPLDAASAVLPEVAPLDALLPKLDGAPALRRARNQLALQQARTGVERAARLPDLTLSLGTQRDDEAGRRQAVVGVAIPLPLFNRNSGSLAAALEHTEQARDELEAVRLEATSGLQAAWTRYGQAKAEAAMLERDIVPEARSLYDLTLTGFEYGKFSFLEVLDAQRSWFQARSRQWQAMLDAWRAHAQIERLIGPTE